MAITNTKYAGRNATLAIGDSAVVATANYTTIGGVRTKGFSSSTEEIDTSDGDDGVHAKGIEGGTKKTTVNVAGLGSNNASYELMKSKEQAGTIWAYKLTFEDGDTVAGLFLVTSFEANGEHNGAQQFSATLASQDTVVYSNA